MTSPVPTDSRILLGSCLDRLKDLPDASVHSIVTDPPYELGFMGKKWDASGIAYNVDVWRECLRVLKPGGHLLAFGGTRTYHRMVVAIEDAGFEIRDSLHWTYGSGFPKSLDVSKAIDKAAGAELEWREEPRRGGDTSGSTHVQQLNGSKPGVKMAADPVTDDAQQWSGWGTALKPSHEPIVVARKPLAGTVTATVLQHGTGALNIDACRVGSESITSSGWTGMDAHRHAQGTRPSDYGGEDRVPATHVGRFPANTILTHSATCNGVCAPDCPVAHLDQQSGTTKNSPHVRHSSGNRAEGVPANYPTGQAFEMAGKADAGGASRFFTVTEWDPTADVASFVYVAKPSKRERGAGCDDLTPQVSNTDTPPGSKGSKSPRAGANRSGAASNFHPTVKPVALMRWLIRLVTPEGGTVLDPFLGSGTTAVAATLEGFAWKGCELTEEYVPIIEARTAWATNEVKNPTPKPTPKVKQVVTVTIDVPTPRTEPTLFDT